MTVDLDELERLARAATPGPWEWEDDNMYGNGDAEKLRADRAAKIYDFWPVRLIETDGGVYGPNEDDRAYISAAHPQAILELIRRVRAEEPHG